MLVDQHSNYLSWARTAFSFSLAPIHSVINLPFYVFNQFELRLKDKNRLIAVNIHLRRQQLILQARLQQLMILESENADLRLLLQAAKRIQSKIKIAELLAVNGEPYIKKVWLNQGKREGVYVGQCVLDAYGVMGQIIRVEERVSQVLLVSDPRSGIAVQDVRNGVRAIAMGDHYSNQLRLMYIPHTVDIRMGDVFITSGLGDHYPAGYLVGKVVTVLRSSIQPFTTIYLQPSAHLEGSRQVLLIELQSK